MYYKNITKVLQNYYKNLLQNCYKSITNLLTIIKFLFPKFSSTTKIATGFQNLPVGSNAIEAGPRSWTTAYGSWTYGSWELRRQPQGSWELDPAAGKIFQFAKELGQGAGPRVRGSWKDPDPNH